jgi:glucokinase
MRPSHRMSLGNAQLIKAINESAVLKLVRDLGPVSRSEIAARTGLTQPTVSSMLDSLAAQGVIQPVGLGASTGGRKPLLFEFNPDAALIIGVDVGGTKMIGSLTNLAGKVQTTIQITHETGPPDPYDRLVALIDSLIQQAPEGATLRGIGLGVAGVTNLAEGVVSLAPGLGWTNFPLGSKLEERFRLPVYLDNDVNAILLGERWFGAARDVSTALCIAIGTGIGAAVLLGGQVYRGANEAAGEIGYFVTDQKALDQAPTIPGSFGWLEALAAGPGIARRGSEALGREVQAPELLHLAAQNDPRAQAVVAETARHLGIALANMACLLNPELIILTGGVMRSGEVLLQAIQEIVAHLAPYPPRIVLSELKEQAGVLGAVALVLEAARRSIHVEA